MGLLKHTNIEEKQTRGVDFGLKTTNPFKGEFKDFKNSNLEPIVFIMDLFCSFVSEAKNSRKRCLLLSSSCLSRVHRQLFMLQWKAPAVDALDPRAEQVQLFIGQVLQEGRQFP